MTYISSTPAGTVSANRVSWTAGTMLPGETRTYQVTGNFSNLADGVYRNVGEAEGKATGDIPVKGIRIHPISVGGGPSMNVSITANATKVRAGDAVTYTFQLMNDGTKDLEGLYAKLSPQPVGSLDFISANYPPQYNAPDAIIWTCDKLPDKGNLIHGATTTISITFKVKPNAQHSFAAVAYGQGNYPGGQIKTTINSSSTEVTA
jgi:hypothetical protein